MDLDDMLDSSILTTILGYEQVNQGIELLARSGAITDPKVNATIMVRVMAYLPWQYNTPFKRPLSAEGSCVSTPAGGDPRCLSRPTAQQHALQGV